MKAVLDMKWQALGERIKVMVGRQTDPFFVFNYLEKQHKRYGVESLFFVLLADYGLYDKNTPRDHLGMQALIKELRLTSVLGIHPSYASNENGALLKKEKKALEDLLGEPVTKSRQHFLKVQFPDTYQRLLDEGMVEEYSMGYASQVGFRHLDPNPQKCVTVSWAPVVRRALTIAGCRRNKDCAPFSRTLYAPCACAITIPCAVTMAKRFPIRMRSRSRGS